MCHSVRRYYDFVMPILRRLKGQRVAVAQGPTKKALQIEMAARAAAVPKGPNGEVELADALREERKLRQFIQTAPEASVQRTPRIRRIDVLYDGLTVWFEVQWEDDATYAPTRVPVSHGGIVTVLKRHGHNHRARFVCSLSRKLLRPALVVALYDVEDFEYHYDPADDAALKPRFTLVSRPSSQYGQEDDGADSMDVVIDDA